MSVCKCQSTFHPFLILRPLIMRSILTFLCSVYAKGHHSHVSSSKKSLAGFPQRRRHFENFSRLLHMWVIPEYSAGVTKKMGILLQWQCALLEYIFAFFEKKNGYYNWAYIPKLCEGRNNYNNAIDWKKHYIKILRYSIIVFRACWKWIC